MKLKKLVSGILATTAIFGCVGTLTACETAHPEVRITIAFEGEEYELNYTLYRKFAPATTAHFLKLAEEGYYDGLCVHDYADSRLYTGAYSYDANEDDNGGLVYKKYYEIVKNYENFPISVYTEDNEPTYTLCGEFSDNHFEWEKGEVKKEEYGSLTMFYTDKSTNDDRISVDHPDSDDRLARDYKDNSATSQFFISLTSTTKSNSKYCTFALLEEDDVEVLDDLKEAIEAYLSDNDEGSEDVTLDVDEDDMYVGEYKYQATYTVLASPITIKTVEVTKT
ncbi:MAG: peptidylprolyl isomerase [Clostridia bacterium]|nr:peptidylprolyl isomerase [Clostridia bacterium]